MVAPALPSGPNILYLWTTVGGHIISGANTLTRCVADEPGTYAPRHQPPQRL
ncbi:MAG: hypothetical protein IPM82_24535 [Saprospiraceae bacterium]|nr:hypothetical protein [Saprospiraceae bacterium]